VNEADFPKQFRHIIRRLKQAGESKEVAEQMAAEDELISDFQNLERKIAAMGETIEEKDKALEENAKTIEENAKTIEENAKALADKDQALAQALAEIEEMKRKLGL
jgi:methyl-accepting chemotaxis protein